MIRIALLALSLAACATVQYDEATTGPFARSFGQTAPFATAETAKWKNYTRVAPAVGTAGAPGEGAIAAAAAVGFATLIDLRQPDEEGVGFAREEARRVGVTRLSMPMPAATDQIPAFMNELAQVLEDGDRYPILLHCGSANRAGAAWALFRARTGVPPSVAIEEGRAAGMTSREALVREVLDVEP